MILFWYVFRDFLKYVIGTISLCTFLFVLFDFIHKTTTYFAKYKPSFDVVAQYYLFQIPMFLIQALPIASLLASVITMVMLNRSNEITAMRAAGLGPFQIVTPLAFGGILLSFAAFFLGEYVVPKSAKRVYWVELVKIEKRPYRTAGDSSRWRRDGNNMVSYRIYDPINETLFGLKMIKLGGSFKPTQSIEAESSTYLEKESRWQLQGVKVLNFSQDGGIARVEKRESELMDLPFAPKKLKKERRKPNQMSIAELSEIVERGENSGVDITTYKVDLNIKYAYPLAAFIVSLIGLRFGYRSERSVETARGVLLALMVGLSYWFILNASRALGLTGELPAWAAAWMANIVIASIVGFQMWRVKNA